MAIASKSDRAGARRAGLDFALGPQGVGRGCRNPSGPGAGAQLSPPLKCFSCPIENSYSESAEASRSSMLMLDRATRESSYAAAGRQIEHTLRAHDQQEHHQASLKQSSISEPQIIVIILAASSQPAKGW
mmetsp:Transcript_33784/g.88917  ORF Transcript_33784/g.88917 Transcript_33784/m.88917 type:complete len:130 (+) Transcript_33784:243-632(+)